MHYLGLSADAECKGAELNRIPEEGSDSEFNDEAFAPISVIFSSKN